MFRGTLFSGSLQVRYSRVEGSFLGLGDTAAVELGLVDTLPECVFLREGDFMILFRVGANFLDVLDSLEVFAFGSLLGAGNAFCWGGVVVLGTE